MVDKSAAHQMNLTVLRRLDPQVEEVGAPGGLQAPSCSLCAGPETELIGPLHALPALAQLLATAGHVALYDFDIPTRKWVGVCAGAGGRAGASRARPRARRRRLRAGRSARQSVCLSGLKLPTVQCGACTACWLGQGSRASKGPRPRPIHRAP